jgi:hypothetical protein
MSIIGGGARVGGALVTAGLVGGVYLTSRGGGDHAFVNTMESRLQTTMSNGDPLSAKGLDIESQTHPNDTSLAAAERNMYENFGENNPDEPGARSRATAACGILALNFKLGEAEVTALGAGFAASKDEAADNRADQANAAFTQAYNACQDDINQQLTHVDTLRIPVNTQQ